MELEVQVWQQYVTTRVPDGSYHHLQKPLLTHLSQLC